MFIFASFYSEVLKMRDMGFVKRELFFCLLRNWNYGAGVCMEGNGFLKW